ncbi:hypothetical protein B488_00960 [Liberibacter crescens BT-1]|uniref:Uncharacterized protein n=1 Tax=Liberibacter crescens (strain BT-1) TaxID=1215343 RepID=L0ERI2_LIBCB|nr:hypothetical protein B488_00960 [Liberibacter crescens BT-1]
MNHSSDYSFNKNIIRDTSALYQEKIQWKKSKIFKKKMVFLF